MDKVRNTAVDLLLRVEKEGAYSTVMLQQAIEKQSFSPQDRGLLTEIFYGTLQRKLTLDYYLAAFVKKMKKIDPWVLQLLRISVYQMVYLEKVPDHAILYEAVQIAKVRGHQGTAKFVNGVLRNMQRQGIPSLETIASDMERASVRYSIPVWILELLQEQYGTQKMHAVAESLLTPPSVSIRIQDIHTTQEEMMQRLAQEGVQTRPSELSECALVVVEGSIFTTDAFRDGLVTVQDEASSLVALVGHLHPGDHVLDTCAAPGGKSTHMAAYLDASSGGSVVSLDLHVSKLRKIRQNAERLHVEDRIFPKALDARHVEEAFEAESFDAVFVDAPCSGLGLMRRKPDIKYTKTPDDLTNLANIQREILDAASMMVKRGGTLVYSTCTINQEENDAVVQAFLSRHTEFELDGLGTDTPYHTDTVTILPSDYQSDGFYIARMKKK